MRHNSEPAGMMKVCVHITFVALELLVELQGYQAVILERRQRDESSCLMNCQQARAIIQRGD